MPITSNMMRVRPRYRWLPVLILAIAVTGFLFGALVIHYSETHQIETAGEGLAVAAANIAASLDDLLYERYADVQVMAKVVTGNMHDRPGLQEYLDLKVKASPVYFWLGVTDANGRIVAASTPESLGKDKSGEPWFKGVRERPGLYVQDAEPTDEAGGAVAVSFTAPIRGVGGEFLGTVTASVGLPILKEVFQRTIRSFELQKGAKAQIEWQFLTRDGDLVVDSRMGEEGKINLKQAGLVSALLSASAQPGYVEETHLSRAVPVVTGYAQAQGRGDFTGLHWAILVRMDRSAVLAPIRAVLWKLGAAGSVVGLPLLGLVLWASGRLRKEWEMAQAESAHARAAETGLRESEAKFRGLLDAAPDAIVIVDREGRMVLANTQAEKTFGYARQELLGKPVEVLVPERFREGHVKHRADYITSPRLRPMGIGRALTGRLKDGREIPIEVSLSHLETQAGMLVMSIIRDLTEHNRTEMALRASEKHFQTLAAVSPVGIFRTDAEGSCLYVNARWCEIAGLAEPAAHGDGWVKALHPGDRERVLAEWRQAVRQNAPFKSEYRFQRPDGVTTWVYGQALAEKDDAGKITGYIGTATDITEHHRLGQQLRHADKMASIGQLAAGVAHEINNPIGFVKSNLNSLQEYSLGLLEVIRAYEGLEAATMGKSAAGPEKASPDDSLRAVAKAKEGVRYESILADLQALLTETKEGVERVRVIVQNLKEFSHVDEGAQKHADINRCLQSTLNLVWNELKYKAEVGKDFGELPEILCNPRELNQVFMNLLVNAAQAITAPGRIGIRTFEQDGHIVVEISDTGSGIPPENLGRIFEPFFTTKDVGKGTGLGLSISYGIVQKHHGRIEVESTVGKGTTFRVRLPIAQPEPAPSPAPA